MWSWFLRLHSTRPIGIAGVSGISETEIASFFRNRQLIPEPWEIELLARLDVVALTLDRDDD